MRWKIIRNKASDEIAIQSECGLWQIARYACSPRYCLFTSEQLGKPFEVVACGDNSQKLKEMASDRSSGR